MSNFELPTSNSPDFRPDVDVLIPEELDEDWCGEFNAAYAGRGIRAFISANEYMSLPQMRNCNFYPAQKSMGVYEVPEQFMDYGALFEGELVGAKQVPAGDDFYIPHVVLRDVVEYRTGWQPVPASEYFWVPIDISVNGDSLYLYEP